MLRLSKDFLPIAHNRQLMDGWRLHLSVTQVSPLCINHHHVPKEHVNPWIELEEISHRRQRTRQILLIAIQVGEYLSH